MKKKLLLLVLLFATTARAEDLICPGDINAICDQFLGCSAELSGAKVDHGKTIKQLHQCQISFENTLESFRGIFDRFIEEKESDLKQIAKLKLKIRVLRKKLSQG